MAVVRITKELTERIQRRARDTFRGRIDAVDIARPGHHWAEYIYEKALGDRLPIMNQLPINYFVGVKEITVTRIGDLSVSLNFTLPDTRRWVVNFDTDDFVQSATFGSNIKLSHDPVWDQLHDEVVAWKARCEAVRKQASDFVEGVSNVLRQFSTLAPAIKEWPALWELIPEDVKDRHREVVERKKTERDTFDTSKLTAVMAASKMGI